MVPDGERCFYPTGKGNQITDAQFASIFFNNIQENAVATVAVEGNTINAENVDAGESGIFFEDIEENANATITINNNQISNVGEVGILFLDITDAGRSKFSA